MFLLLSNCLANFFEANIELAINLYILVSVFWYFYNKNQSTELRYILVITIINIILTEIFLCYSIALRLSSNLYLFIINFLWLRLIAKYYKKELLFFTFGVLTIISYSLVDFNITGVFNKLFFVLTALLYVILFLLLCFKKLHQENIDFFQSSNFIILFAPVLFFLGMSLLWGFQNSQLNSYILFADFTLYNFINLIANLVYYTLINIYIFKMRKL